MNKIENISVVGLRIDWDHNTYLGNVVYRVIAASSDGHIFGPWMVNGSLLSYWGLNVNHADNIGYFVVKIRTTGAGREIVDNIKSEKED